MSTGMNFTNLGTVRGWNVNSIAYNQNTDVWALVSTNGLFAHMLDSALVPLQDVGLRGGWTLNMATYDMDQNLWAVGKEGNVGKWMNSSWEDRGKMGGWTMGMLACDPTNTMWGVGSEGNLGEWNGAAWKNHGFPGGWHLRAVGFRFGDEKEVYCVSQNGLLGKYEFDTGQMMLIPTPGWQMGNIVFSPDGQVAYGISIQGEVGYYRFPVPK